MKYMLLMYTNESAVLETPEHQQAVAPPVWYALMEEMKDAGVLLSNTGLSPVAGFPWRGCQCKLFAGWADISCGRGG
jgi:hypothetical protein